MRRFVLALAIVCFAVSHASAGVYFGASGGKSRYETTISGFQFRGDATAWKLYAGFTMFKFFGLEAVYADFGSTDDTVNGVRLDSEATAWEAFAVGTIPLGPVQIFGKAGMARWNADGTVSDGVLTADASSDGTDPAWGVGIAWKFAPLLSVRGEFERINASGDTKIDMATIGLGVQF